jgi:hypothetical protein
MADQRERIKHRVGTYRERLAEIRADKALSPLGKRRAIEALYQETKAEVDPLRAEMAQRETMTARELERRLFGLEGSADPSAVIAYRDAMDRVSAVRRPEELGELMERAASTGDSSLLRAAAAHAWRQSRNPLASDSWGGLVDEYVQQTPGTERDYQAFQEANTPLGPTRALAEKMEMSLGGTPSELNTPESRLSDAPEGAPASSYW